VWRWYVREFWHKTTWPQPKRDGRTERAREPQRSQGGRWPEECASGETAGANLVPLFVRSFAWVFVRCLRCAVCMLCAPVCLSRFIQRAIRKDAHTNTRTLSRSERAAQTHRRTNRQAAASLCCSRLLLVALSRAKVDSPLRPNLHHSMRSSICAFVLWARLACESQPASVSLYVYVKWAALVKVSQWCSPVELPQPQPQPQAQP